MAYVHIESRDNIQSISEATDTEQNISKGAKKSGLDRNLFAKY